MSDYEVYEMEQETDLATCEESEPAEKNGIGFGGILAGAAIVGGAIWGAKKLYNKFCKNEERETKKLEKQAEKLRKAGYRVDKVMCEDEFEILEEVEFE